MQENTLNFDERCGAAVKRFVRTAVLIDDEIEVHKNMKEEPTGISAPPFADINLQTPLSSTFERGASVSEKITSSAVTNGEAENEHPSEVSLKPLADAFLDRQIVCGVLKPESQDEVPIIVKRAVRSAAVADIVIIDWYLRPGNAEIAKQILASVLQNDRNMKGRLRLILVYTSATPLIERQNELKGYLESDGLTTIALEGSTPRLSIASCRICFVQKPSGTSGKIVTDLPEFAINEFTAQAKGLLPSFVLSGIAALREATHHLLSTFSERLDSAFVGHRMLLHDVDDARDFALGLLILQIRGIFSQPNMLGSALTREDIEAWFRDRYETPERAQMLQNQQINADDLLTAILDGRINKNKKKFHTALFDPDSETTICFDFSRLSTFIREYDGFNPLPAEWRPRLTLGSVLRVRTDNSPRYYLCLQPLCDTVRLDVPHFFPFIELKPKADIEKSNFWISVRDGTSAVHIGLDMKAGSRHYDKFRPDDKDKCVLAELEEGAVPQLVFKSHTNGRYEWVGDIEISKAQKAANEVSAALSRVGLDEYEWLRSGATIKK